MGRDTGLLESHTRGKILDEEIVFHLSELYISNGMKWNLIWNQRTNSKFLQIIEYYALAYANFE